MSIVYREDTAEDTTINLADNVYWTTRFIYPTDEPELLEVFIIFDEGIPDLIIATNSGCQFAKSIPDRFAFVAFRDNDIHAMGYDFTRCLTYAKIIKSNGATLLLDNPRWQTLRTVALHRICVACADDRELTITRALKILDEVIEVKPTSMTSK